MMTFRHHPPGASIKDLLEGTKTVETKVKQTVEAEAEKPVEVEKAIEIKVETANASVTEPVSLAVMAAAQSLEKEKSINEEVLVITVPSSYAPASEVPTDDENSPLRPDETPGDYYYRAYLEKRASDIHAPVWKLKQGDTLSDWQVCRDWLQGIFSPAEIKFQEEQSYEHTYHSYLEETVSSTSTIYLIVRECRSMYKEWDAFEASKKEVVEEKAKVAILRAKLEADKAKFEGEQNTDEWSAMGWKRKVEAEAAQLAEARKRLKEMCEKDNNEKRALRIDVNNLKAEIEKLKKEKADAEAARDESRSHRERSEQREVQTYATLALRNKEIKELTSLLNDQE
ncbi:hypothetical protein HanPI659440_Chr03g0116541 [Helianthus annuus]|nr:hypothetical protein HanPI659440_Chr03g0116541 [Helianthus annuus]